MSWEYALLIGLIFGIIIGVIIMYFSYKKLRQQQILSYKLKNNEDILEEYRKGLISYFAHSIDLLENLIQDHHRLYRYITEGSNDLLLKVSRKTTKNTPQSCNNFSESEADNDQIPTHTV